MQLTDTLKVVKNYLNNPNSIYTLEGRVDVFKKTVGYLEEGFNLLQENKPANPSPEITKSIGDVIQIIRRAVIVKVLDKDFKKFVETFCLLLKNWNDNTIKSDALNNDSIMLSNYIKYHFTTLEMFDQIKLLMQHIEKIKLTSHAPIELSRHFLASLDTKIEKLGDGPVDEPKEMISRRTFKSSKGDLIEVQEPGVNCEQK